MPRHPRNAPGGYVYHALNRGVARLPLFEKDGDYEAFERVVVEAAAEHPTRILGYCLTPNHWHFVLWPSGDYWCQFIFSSAQPAPRLTFDRETPTPSGR